MIGQHTRVAHPPEPSATAPLAPLACSTRDTCSPTTCAHVASHVTMHAVHGNLGRGGRQRQARGPPACQQYHTSDGDTMPANRLEGGSTTHLCKGGNRARLPELLQRHIICHLGIQTGLAPAQPPMHWPTQAVKPQISCCHANSWCCLAPYGAANGTPDVRQVQTCNGDRQSWHRKLKGHGPTAAVTGAFTQAPGSLGTAAEGAPCQTGVHLLSATLRDTQHHTAHAEGAPTGQAHVMGGDVPEGRCWRWLTWQRIMPCDAMPWLLHRSTRCIITSHGMPTHSPTSLPAAYLGLLAFL
jgi:hypothetical protein